MNLTPFFIDWAECGKIPDFIIRAGIRKLCRARLHELESPNLKEAHARKLNYVEALKKSPIAIATQKANDQHYEVPADFYRLTLGRSLKYSSAYFPKGNESLNEAEGFALSETLKHADLSDGQMILELGCGWGSLTFAMARTFPNSKITAISNSNSQREFILAKAAKEGLTGISVLTRNVAEGLDFLPHDFHRVVSVEMFEHMKNYEKLLFEISKVLAPGGKLFVHIFTHREHPYPFETEGEDNWMGKYFFTGGQMPSRDLLSFFQTHLILEKQWEWSGTHYSKTSEEWLKNQDTHREEILNLFRTRMSDSESIRWFNRWRIFFLSCAELFRFDNGKEWGVTHYRFKKPE